MKKLENLLAGIIIGGLICMVAYALTSCRTSGYGCYGKSTWGQTLKRANKMY